jgi:hypothetical protein
MNINHGVRNSIYRTGRAAALRARLTMVSLKSLLMRLNVYPLVA